MHLYYHYGKTQTEHEIPTIREYDRHKKELGYEQCGKSIIRRLDHVQETS